MGPLEGYRIIDLTIDENTMICSSLLADFGAEVIKIRADEFIPVDSKKGYFTTLNRGIKSVKLDIFTSEGIQLYKKIIATADAVICNYKEEQLIDAGIDYLALKEINRKIVFATTNSFGIVGETEDDELIAVADSGLMYMTGDENGAPIAPGFNAGSHWLGMSCLFGILASIINAHNTGEGNRFEISMRDSLFNICEGGVFMEAVLHKKHVRNGNHDTGVSPYGVFKAKDGYLAISVVSNSGWKKFANTIGRFDMLEDSRFLTFEDRVANSTAMIEEVQKFTSVRTKAENQKHFLENGVSCGPVFTMEEALNGEQLNSREMVKKVNINGIGELTMVNLGIKTYGTPGKLNDFVPSFGENTYEVLSKL